MNKEVLSFVDKYVNDIKNNSAALFIGAGFSKSSGFVDWKDLIKNVADDLDLDIEKENDLVSLAQYSYNKNQNRSLINSVIFDEFSKNVDIDENHRILARLPIFTFWTTNYDSLIEDALRDAKRMVDVKYKNSHLAISLSHRDAIVYKMHGDKSDPDEAVLIKDDYEKYYRERTPFVTALCGDLISKTFLFIGFSFSDPNIDYILSRIRIEYGAGNNRQHYALFRTLKKEDYKEKGTGKFDKAKFEYDTRKYKLLLDDLKRYNIKALMINDYSEITDILNLISKRINQNNVFISGSASDYDRYSKEEALDLISLLSKNLIKNNFNVISGFGLGVGSAVITGALEEIYINQKNINNERLLLRPFPQDISDPDKRQELWKKYREDMISRAGISIFVFGNKLEEGNVVKANGMIEEFEIAKANHNLIVPVGCTGYVSLDIWNEINANISTYYGDIDEDLLNAFKKLNVNVDNENLVNNISFFIKLFDNNKYKSL